MEYQSLSGLQQSARIYGDFTTHELTRSKRLERWRQLLEREPERVLTTLTSTEYASPSERDAMRSANSPLTVAFEDPVLRTAGLTDDTYGTAKRFFEISDRQLHRVVCYCHHGAHVHSKVIARQVQALNVEIKPSGLLSRVRDWMGWR